MPQGTLKKALRGMLVEARQAPGRPVVRSLGGVVTVEITQLESGMLQLSIERLNIAPTQATYHNILAQWPEAAPGDLALTPRKDGRRHALIGRWPRPVEVGELAG